MTSLEGILDRPRIAQATRVPCDAGNDREVSGVALVEDVHELGQLSSGKIAVLTETASALRAYQLDVAVRLASEAGLVALFVHARATPDGLPSTTRRLARHGALSVVTVADGTDLGRLIIDVHDELTASTSAVIERAASALARLDTERWGPDPLPAMAAAVSEELGIAVEVDGTAAGQRHVEVMLDGRRHARFSYSAPLSPSEPVVALVLHRAASVAEHTIADARRAVERPAATRSSLLAELLSSSSEEAGPLLKRARPAGLVIDGWHTAVHIQLDNVGAFTGGDELARFDTIAEAARLALGTAQSEQENWNRIDAASEVVLVRSDSTEPEASTGRSVHHTTTRILVLLGEQFPALQLYCGIGGSYRGLEGLQTSTAEARAGAAAAHTAGKAAQPVAFRNLGLRRSLLQWYAMGSSRITVQRLLAPLDELGPRRKEQAMETLRAYFENPGSMAEAAAAIGVHRNTMHRRVEQLFDLLDVDERNADHRLLLQLACRMYTV